MQAVRITLENGFKSPQIGKYKAFNAEWNAPLDGCQIRKVKIRHTRGQFVEAITLHGDYNDVVIEGTNHSG